MLPDTIKNILSVGAGSFIGGIARYIMCGFLSRNDSESTSWGLFLTVGLCGGFTTFSTFSKEALIMLQAGQTWSFASYITVSVLAGIALASLGYYIAR